MQKWRVQNEHLHSRDSEQIHLYYELLLGENNNEMKKKIVRRERADKKKQ